MAVRTAAVQPEVVACIGIASAVAEKKGITAGLPDPSDLDLKAKLLFICGANDEQVSPDACRAWIEQVPRAQYIEVRGANHFFWGKYDDLAELVSRWLEDNVLKSG